MQDEEGIVIVNGSSTVQAGIAGEDCPTAIFRNAISSSNNASGFDKDCYVGSEAQQLRDLSSLRYPVQHGLVIDWDAMERIWEHAFHQLRVASCERPCLLAEAVLTPKIQREVTAQVMFEGLQSPGLTVEDKAKLSLYSSGRGSGIVLNCGHGVTSVFPLYEGYCTSSAIRRQDLAGGEVTAYLAKQLTKRGLAIASSRDMEIVRDIKEKMCHVGKSESDPYPSSKSAAYELPDGQEIHVDKEANESAEVLFTPSRLKLEELGLHELIFDSLMACDVDTRGDLCVNIIIAGGTTLMKGFPERLQTELARLLPPKLKVRVVTSTERFVSSWIGGSILGSLSLHTYISKEDYEEYGPSIVHRNHI